MEDTEDDHKPSPAAPGERLRGGGGAEGQGHANQAGEGQENQSGHTIDKPKTGSGSIPSG